MARFAAATSPAEYTDLNTWLVEQVAALEADQSQRFYQVVPEQLSFAKGTPAQLPTERPR